MTYFSYDQIAGAVIILLALAGSFVLIGNGVELIRKWIAAHQERQQLRDNKIDFLKDQNTQHRQGYQDVVNLKRQIGKIEENVQKIDNSLGGFIETHQKEMTSLNQETALQTGAITSLLDFTMKNNPDAETKELEDERKKIDEFLIHRGR